MEFSNYFRTTVLIALLALQISCSNTSSSSGAPVQTPDTGSGTPATVDIKRIVTTGQSLTFNDQTGGAFDVELNPVSKLPAVAYHDKNHVGNGTGATPALGALKYAYLDTNGNWNVEVIDVAFGAVACGGAGSYCIGAPNAANTNNAGIIALAFKSDGTPAIAYVYGASFTGPGTKEIRYAYRSTAGVWTVESAFSSTIGGAGEVSAANTVDPLKGVTLLFDGSDRAHVTFALYAATIANSQIKYSFRNDSGTWATSTIAGAIQSGVGAAPGAISAPGQGALQAGAAFCSAAAGPIYAYQIVTSTAGLGHPAFIRCTSVAASGQCSSFSVLDLVNDCNSGANACSSSFTFAADGTNSGTNAGSRLDLTIEPSTQKPVLAFYSTAAPATGVQVIQAPSACDQAQSSATNGWGTLTVVESGATNGQNGLKITATGTNSFLLSYNVSTTSVKINRSISGVSGFFASGTTIETTTVAGEGVGTVYDSASDTVYVGYAKLPGAAANATGNDIVVGYADPDIITSGGTAGSFVLDIMDNTNNAFPTPTQNSQPFMTAAKASNGLVGYAYFFQDATLADAKLYYGIRGGSTTAPIFSERSVTSYQEGSSAVLAVGLAPSLTYDTNSNPIIAFNNTAGTELNLQVARSVNNGSNFAVTVVDDTSADIGRWPSVATYQSYIGISYRDQTNTALKFARYTTAGGWRAFPVDGMTGSGVCDTAKDSGHYSKLLFTSTGKPVIAFQNDISGTNATVRIAVAGQAVSSSSFTWTCLDVDNLASNVRGEGLDVKLDSQDRIHIAHYDYTVGTMRYLYSTADVASAVATGVGAFSTAVELANVGAISAMNNANYVPSLQITSANVVYVGFQDISADRFTLATGSPGGTFTTETIESAPTGTTSTTPIVGQNNIMLLNSSNKPMFFYRSWENWIKYFSRE